MRLEKQGMTAKGGRKVSTHMRKLLGLKRTFPIDDLIKLCEQELEKRNEETSDSITPSGGASTRLPSIFEG